MAAKKPYNQFPLLFKALPGIFELYFLLGMFIIFGALAISEKSTLDPVGYLLVIAGVIIVFSLLVIARNLIAKLTGYFISFRSDILIPPTIKNKKVVFYGGDGEDIPRQYRFKKIIG